MADDLSFPAKAAGFNLFRLELKSVPLSIDQLQPINYYS